MENDKQEKSDDVERKFIHVLPGEHVYEGVLFFGYTPADTLDAVKEFNVRNDDVILATYPKAGTTWLQEIAWLIMNGADFDGAYQKQVYFRSPFLEFKDESINEVGLDIASALPSPRVIKTHLPVQLMPKQIYETQCKIIVGFRNPKDLCVSYYHFYRSSSSFGNFTGTWEDFFDMFMEGHVDHGSWFHFTKSWWKFRNRPNIRIVYFEDMKQNLRAEVAKLCEFLGIDLADDVIDRIADHCHFDNMKQNPMTNHLDMDSIDSKISPLLRKGTVGDWKFHFTVAQNDRFDKFFNDQMGPLNIPFKYTIP